MRAVIAGLPWVLSALTIYINVLAGNKHRHTWVLGLFAQALWAVWIIASETWGLLPLNAALWYVYIRNHYKWKEVSDELS